MHPRCGCFLFSNFTIFARMKKLIVSIVLLFTISYTGYCLVIKDTIPGFKVISYRFNNDYTTVDSVPIDTLLRGFQLYNPAFQNLAFNNFLGNLASPYQSVLFGDYVPFGDFIFGQSTSYNNHKPIETLYYNARHPYTIITYFANFPSMQEEQKIKIVHTQNINRNFNAGASIDLVNSIGNYSYQENTASAISLFSSFKSHRYSIYGNINFNNNKITENGGFLNSTLYQSLNSSGEPTPTNLTGAGSLFKQTCLFVFQRFYLTGSYALDSLRTSSKWNDALSVIHRMTFSQSTRSFADNLTTGDSAFYIENYKYGTNKNFGFNKDTTIDSVFMLRFENIFQLAFNANQWLKIPAEIRVGIKNQIDRINTWSLDSTSAITPGLEYFTQTTGLDSSKNLANPSFRNIIINNSLIGSLTDQFQKL